MTKTLTEQWREGEIFGLYYVKIPKEEACIHNVSCMDYLIDEYGVEVLARVPSYEELTLMAGNYRLAKKALRDCYNEMKYWATMNHRCSKIFNNIKAALVEIEEVK